LARLDRGQNLCAKEIGQLLHSISGGQGPSSGRRISAAPVASGAGALLMKQPPITGPGAHLAAHPAFQSAVPACNARTALDCEPGRIPEAVAEG